MTENQLYNFCSNTILWTIIGAFLGAILGMILTILYNKKNSRILLRAWKWEKCIDYGITINPNLMISVINDSKITIPLLNVHLMGFNKVNVKLQPVDNNIMEIKSGQIVQFQLKVLESENQLTENAKEILRAKPKDFAVRAYIDKSNKGPVYVDKQLAMEVFQSISELVGRDYKKKTLIDDLPFEQRQKILEELKESQVRK